MPAPILRARRNARDNVCAIPRWASLHVTLATVLGSWKSDAERLRRLSKPWCATRWYRAGGPCPGGWADRTPSIAATDAGPWRGSGTRCSRPACPRMRSETVMIDAGDHQSQRFASGARGGGKEDLGRWHGRAILSIRVVDQGGLPTANGEDLSKRSEGQIRGRRRSLTDRPMARE